MLRVPCVTVWIRNKMHSLDGEHNDHLLLLLILFCTWLYAFHTLPLDFSSISLVSYTVWDVGRRVSGEFNIIYFRLANVPSASDGHFTRVCSCVLASHRIFIIQSIQSVDYCVVHHSFQYPMIWFMHFWIHCHVDDGINRHEQIPISTEKCSSSSSSSSSLSFSPSFTVFQFPPKLIHSMELGEQFFDVVVRCCCCCYCEKGNFHIWWDNGLNDFHSNQFESIRPTSAVYNLIYCRWIFRIFYILSTQRWLSDRLTNRPNTHIHAQIIQFYFGIFRFSIFVCCSE